MSIQRTIARYKSRLNWGKSKWEKIAKIGKGIIKENSDKKEKRRIKNATTSTQKRRSEK